MLDDSKAPAERSLFRTVVNRYQLLVITPLIVLPPLVLIPFIGPITDPQLDPRGCRSSPHVLSGTQEKFNHEHPSPRPRGPSEAAGSVQRTLTAAGDAKIAKFEIGLSRIGNNPAEADSA
jgi:hypothetical protein